jgi:hypothetical protein
MTEKQIRELAAILVNDYGHAALQVAARRRDQHVNRPHSESYRLWARIAEATERLLRVDRRRKVATDAPSREALPGHTTADQRGRNR